MAHELFFIVLWLFFFAGIRQAFFFAGQFSACTAWYQMNIHLYA